MSGDAGLIHVEEREAGMSDRIVIRDLEPTDVEAIADIAVAAWVPIFAYYREAMGEELFALACPDWQEDKAGQVRRACEPDHPAMVCVATSDGCVVGFATYYANRASGIGEIGNNAVHPDFQGRGIATRLYSHVFARLRELDVRFVKVGTGGDPAHAPARRAYERAGFSIRLPHVEYYRKL